MSRPQAVEFTQYLLPEEAWLDPETVWDTLRGPESTAWLAALWAQAHQYANAPAPPIAPDGLVAEQCPVGRHEGVLISLPPPVGAPEAWFALLVRTPAGPAPFRYFMLETAPADAGGAAAETLITERQADADVRHERGAGPAAPSPTTAAAFIIAVAKLLDRGRPRIPNVTA